MFDEEYKSDQEEGAHIGYKNVDKINRKALAPSE
jgi:hypothetical protein